jgi:hypothetical protein
MRLGFDGYGAKVVTDQLATVGDDVVPLIKPSQQMEELPE